MNRAKLTLPGKKINVNFERLEFPSEFKSLMFFTVYLKYFTIYGNTFLWV